MYNVLSDLNKTSGIKGSMLVGSDGIIIAADLDGLRLYNDLEVGSGRRRPRVP